MNLLQELLESFHLLMFGQSFGLKNGKKTGQQRLLNQWKMKQAESGVAVAVEKKMRLLLNPAGSAGRIGLIGNSQLK